jgi:cold shock CspA family protein
MMSPTAQIEWSIDTDLSGADPTVALCVNRRDWEVLGARFHAIDDGQGEQPLLASATVETRLGPVSLGVLDYGGDSTYLLISRDEYPDGIVDALLESLESAGLSDIHELVYDRQAHRATSVGVEERLLALEAGIAEILKRFRVVPSDTSRPARKAPRPVSGPTSPARGRFQGTVSWFDSEQGIGYIRPDSGGAEILVEEQDIVPDSTGFRGLVEGARVAYDIEEEAPRRRWARVRGYAGPQQAGPQRI